MKKKLIHSKIIIVLLACLFSFSASETKALCITKLIKIKQLRGIATDNRGNPFPNVKIELRNVNDFDFVIKSVETNNEGNFDLGEIKSGKYTIYAGNEYLSSFAFEVKYKKVKKIKNNEPQLKIVVGTAITGGCRGWSASYGKRGT